MRTFEEIKNTVETGLGLHPCDLLLKNVTLVNVFSGEIYPTQIYLKGKRIVSIDSDVELEAKKIIDCGGQYAVPGLIDAHMHFETTMLSPEALSALTVPWGTTTLCADLMEIANVAGAEGLKAMSANMDNLPCRMILEVPSRVPSAPGLETTGAVLDAEAVKEIMGWDDAISLGELDPSKILFVKDEYLHKVADTLTARKVINGHAIGRMGQELNVYASSGISDDHECVSKDEMIARLRVGMKVLIREGSTERNLDELITAALESGCKTEHLCFCTDDKHPNEIKEEGHISYNVRRSIELGMDPMTAISIATINPARHFRIEDEIGSITPGRLGDILIIPDLKEMKPSMVFFEGKPVAKDGSLVEDCPLGNYPAWIKDTVHLKNPITEKSFAVPAVKKDGTKAEDGRVTVNVIGMIPRQIINNWLCEKLPVKNGEVLCDPSRDILKLSVVERYGRNGNVGTGFVKGFQLKDGALAFSTSHDHHNIVCVGADEASMAAAVNEIARLHGGLSCARAGKVTASMALPIGGLISDKPAPEILAEIVRMNDAAKAIGCALPAPFMALSFISLPTVPELGLTDKGLIDVLKHELISVVTE